MNTQVCIYSQRDPSTDHFVGMIFCECQLGRFLTITFYKEIFLTHCIMKVKVKHIFFMRELVLVLVYIIKPSVQLVLNGGKLYTFNDF